MCSYTELKLFLSVAYRDRYGLAGNHANVPNLALSEKMAMSRSGMYYMNR